MKILILQLARLGDIYMTWPAVRALRRMNPKAEIHLMTRTRFQVATRGLEVINQSLVFATEDFLEPILQKDPDLDESQVRLGNFINRLKKEKYDWVINFSFSPLSSYLTHAIAGPNATVTGYTRHNDGFLNIPDDMSAYFYAQVGVDRHNRIHLADIFAAMINVELIAEDWGAPQMAPIGLTLPEKFITIHVGASEARKALPAFKWARVIRFILEKNVDRKIVLIGSPDEKSIAEAITASVPQGSVIDLVGKTLVTDLFEIVKKSTLLVGCDSAPMHIASLTNTPCLNISFTSLNFWETGPRSEKVWILRAAKVEEVVSEYLGHVILQILSGESLPELIRGISGVPSFVIQESSEQRFCWDLVMAIYLGAPYPMADDIRFYEGIVRLNEINKVAIEQMEMCRKTGVKKMIPYLQRADEIIETLGKIVPELQVIVRWLQTEKLRISPLSESEILERTIEIHTQLKSVLAPYLLPDEKEGIYG